MSASRRHHLPVCACCSSFGTMTAPGTCFRLPSTGGSRPRNPLRRETPKFELHTSAFCWQFRWAGQARMRKQQTRVPKPSSVILPVKRHEDYLCASHRGSSVRNRERDIALHLTLLRLVASVSEWLPETSPPNRVPINMGGLSSVSRALESVSSGALYRLATGGLT